MERENIGKNASSTPKTLLTSPGTTGVRTVPREEWGCESDRKQRVPGSAGHDEARSRRPPVRPAHTGERWREERVRTRGARSGTKSNVGQETQGPTSQSYRATSGLTFDSKWTVRGVPPRSRRDRCTVTSSEWTGHTRRTSEGGILSDRPAESSAQGRTKGPNVSRNTTSFY